MAPPPVPPPPPPAHAEAWGSLSLAGEANAFRQSIGFDFVRAAPSRPGASDQPAHWWRLHRVTEPNPSLRREDWVDSRTCPGVDAAMRLLASLPDARFSDPGDAQAERLIRRSVDGTDFVLEARGGLRADPPWRTTAARIRIQGNDLGELGAWYAQLTLAADPCWSVAKPPD
ncbi:MAG: hypothetical protein INR64_13245 [Caulobacteraceae bacterium]|nr:hypothetical protein [Caulobacter sp.]